MPIDNCQHSFEVLTETVLPAHFARLEQAIQQAIPATRFAGPRSATRQALAAADRTSDFPGCYVFISEGKPMYVGISRSVINRLTQHLNQVSHYSASLVYRMSSDDYPHEMKRDQAMKDDKFKEVFLTNQQKLQGMRVAFVEIPNDLELYVFEVYASMKLNTEKGNTFRTH